MDLSRSNQTGLHRESDFRLSKTMEEGIVLAESRKAKICRIPAYFISVVKKRDCRSTRTTSQFREGKSPQLVG